MMQMTMVQASPSHSTFVTGTSHQPLAATATAKPVTHAIAKITIPCASRKLRSLGTSARTRSSAPASQVHARVRTRAALGRLGESRVGVEGGVIALLLRRSQDRVRQSNSRFAYKSEAVRRRRRFLSTFPPRHAGTVS